MYQIEFRKINYQKKWEIKKTLLVKKNASGRNSVKSWSLVADIQSNLHMKDYSKLKVILTKEKLFWII